MDRQAFVNLLSGVLFGSFAISRVVRAVNRQPLKKLLDLSSTEIVIGLLWLSIFTGSAAISINLDSGSVVRLSNFLVLGSFSFGFAAFAVYVPFRLTKPRPGKPHA